MTVKLGQLLIKAGRITQVQLEEALRNQVVHGGKLGTNLVELGYINEHELALVLGHKLGVPFINQEQIIGISQDVTVTLSPEIAEKYLVMPLERDKKRLTLAMADPSDLAAIDAIAFLTGMFVKPVVCPELLLIKLLEKHYGIKRRLRYGVLKHPPVKETTSLHELSHPASPKVLVETTAERLHDCEIPILDNFEGFHHLDGDQFEDVYYGESTHTSSLDQITHELADARNRDAIADALLKFISIAFPVAAVFLIRANVIEGWKSLVRGEPSPHFPGMAIPLAEPSILNTTYTNKSFFLGPIPDSPANREIEKVLSMRVQGAVLILPFIILDRVVAFLYLGGEAEKLTARLPELQRLVAKASMAFEILILRNKILMS